MANTNTNMKEKLLYIYGYGSNSNDASTMKAIKEVADNLRYDLISIEYDPNSPDGLMMIEHYIHDNNIKYVISHSIGGFMVITHNINSNIPNTTNVY